MSRLAVLSAVLSSCLILTLAPSPARGQAPGFPEISDRSYTGGTIEVTVTGSTTIKQDIPLNPQASFSGGGMTWLQFGVSGAAEPNALITYSDIKETGVTVGKGKWIATGGIMPGEKSPCSGKAKVTATEIVGDYTCKGLTSHDPEGGMGKVDIKVRFTAKT